ACQWLADFSRQRAHLSWQYAGRWHRRVRRRYRTGRHDRIPVSTPKQCAARHNQQCTGHDARRPAASTGHAPALCTVPASAVSQQRRTTAMRGQVMNRLATAVACLALSAPLMADCLDTTARADTRVPGKEGRPVQSRACHDDGAPRAPLYQDQPPQAVPDRWRIVDSLPGYNDNLLNPYQRNVLKGDKPVYGEWFFSVTGISDTVYEWRDIPTPVGPQTSADGGDLDIFGNGEQTTFNQNLLIELVWLRGDTVFRPPDWEFRLIPVLRSEERR